MSKKNTVKPGALVHIESGAYSSRSTVGWFVCVQEFSPEETLAEYMTAHDEQSKHYSFDNDAFMAFVLSKGVIAEVAEFFDEWHLADYSNASEVEFFPRAALRRSE